MDLCPRMEEVAALVEGGLSAEGRDLLQDHLARCETCQLLLVDHAALSGPPLGNPHERLSLARRGHRFRIARAAAGSAAAAGLLIGALFLNFGSRTRPLGTLETAAGQTRHADLGEALIHLGERTRIVEEKTSPGERRRLRLEYGSLEAHVRGGHGDWVVQTAAGEVHVLGTRFEVRVARLSTGDPVLSVSVSEGRVRLESVEGNLEIRKGETGYALKGGAPRSQAGQAVCGPEDAARLVGEMQAASAAGRDQEVRWIEAVLRLSGRDGTEALEEAGR